MPTCRAMLPLPILVSPVPLLAPSETIRIARTFRAQESDIYVVRMQMSVPQGEVQTDVDLRFKVRQTVQSILDSGEAIVISSLSEFTRALDGGEPERDPTRKESALYRVGPNGVPTAEGKVDYLGFRIIHYASLVASSTLELGQSSSLTWTPERSPNARCEGRQVLESHDADTAKLTAHWTIDGGDGKPISMAVSSTFDRRTGKLIAASGTVLSQGPHAAFKASQFSIQRELK